MYLVDTNVISAGAPAKAPPPGLVRWMDTHSTFLYLSAVTVAEIADGITKLRREGRGRRADALTAWLDTVLHLYGSRVLPLDTPTARIAGTLSDLARSRGHAPGFADIVIAATARRHQLTLLTRNIRHFAPLDVPVIDPFESLPPEG